MITKAPVGQGSEVAAGDVLVEVSGRPLVAFAGSVPAYRDLRPGSEGDDVAQLQASLAKLGFTAEGDAEGHFGAATKRAVSEFYESIGYEAQRTGSADAVGGAREAVQSAEWAVEDADRAVDEAEREAGAAHAAMKAAERAVSDAEDDLRRAKDEAGQTPTPTPTPDPDVVALAEQQLAAAQDELDSAEDAYDAARHLVEDAERNADRARDSLVAARDEFSSLTDSSGPIMPLSEMVFVPSFPARVAAVNGQLGQAVQAPLLTLSTGELVVEVELSPADRELVAKGMSAEILSELQSVTASGTVSHIGELAESPNGKRFYSMTVSPTTPLDTSLAGDDVRVTIAAASTEEPVLVVPLAAVSASADGETSVSKLLSDGFVTRVPVRAGVSGDGFVAVEPVDGGALLDGDDVVVGQ